MNLLFLVGAGRSGTTLLYKILSLHKEVGYISNYDERLPQFLSAGLLLKLTNPYSQLKLSSWFKKGGNAYDFERPWLRRVFPTPVEGEVVYKSCGLPLNPDTDFELTDEIRQALQKRFNRLYDSSGCRLFVTKRTANNRRIKLLSQAFPDAKYINLMRDGREVAYSLSKVNWWEDHVIWWAGETAAQLEQKGANRYALSARNWVEEVNTINSGLNYIDDKNCLNVRYEDLVGDDSVNTLKTIMDFLQIPLTDEYLSVVDSLGLKSRAPSWKRDLEEKDIKLIMNEQTELLNQYGYLEPKTV